MKQIIAFVILLIAFHTTKAQTCQANFTIGTGYYTPQLISITNTSSGQTIPNTTTNYTVNWGDGSGGMAFGVFGNATYHKYYSAGTFLITVVMTITDNITQTTLCSSLDTHSVTIVMNPCHITTSYTQSGNTFTFTANNVGGGNGLNYAWSFGDGGTGTGQVVNHTFATSGNFLIICVASANGYLDSSYIYLQITSQINCNNVVASFQGAGSGLTYNFWDNSTNIPSLSVKKDYSWNFGDGSPIVNHQSSPTHIYTTSGTYQPTLTVTWIDSPTNVVICTKSFTQSITIFSANEIAGKIFFDSTLTAPSVVQFKLWLITFDSTNNILSAVDSLIVSGSGPMSTYYKFTNKQIGLYRIKAAVVNGTIGATSFIPTYHDTSTYWNNAIVINHIGGISWRNIFMKSGTWGGGSGFIGGNVQSGANKGAGSNGTRGLLITLQNNFGEPIRFTYTDNNGDYSFGNLPAGNYVVYPEELNHITTPSSIINITSGKYIVSGINFKHTSTHITPISTEISPLSNELFSLYPNPSDGKLTILSTNQIQDYSIQILDLTGRVVLQREITAAKSLSLDLSSLNNGIYFVKYLSHLESHTERILLKR
ncbi:MAG: PKD domain-containing protein [Bacteroidetes bacterium]|nr:PKD domain-containing protein [Bacteroidota bacterium]MBS1740157.1 PKD domain-containing protein [Bacteroidota bacterium]